MSISKPPQPDRQSLEESLPPYDRHAYDDPPADPSIPLVSSDVEGSALKPRPRWWQFWRFSSKAKTILAAVMLALVALVATMIWYGVHRAQESKLNNPADLSAARNMVEPKIFTSLISSDGDLLASFTFSPPTVSNASFINTLDATILTSSSQLLQVPTPISSSSYFVKIFGQRSTNIVFASSSGNSTNWSARVDAFWKVSSGGNQDARKQWGTDQLSQTVGGSYGYKVGSSDGDSAVGLALQTVGTDTFGDSSVFPIASEPDLWLDSSMLFTVTILVPPTFSARRLDISTAKGDLDVQDLNNVTFDSVDVRLGSGSIATSSPLFSPSLSIYASRGISGSYSLASGTLLSHGSIHLSNLTFTPPSTLPSPSSSAYNLTLVTTNGDIIANITSFATSGSYVSSPGGVNLNVTSQGGGTDIFFPFDSYNGAFELATNEGLPTVKKALTSGGGTFTVWGGGALVDGKVQKKLQYKFTQGGVEADGKGMVRMNADKGDVRLYVVPGTFYNY